MIAGTLPVGLLAAERMEIYKVKSTGNHITGHFRETPLQNGTDYGTMTVEEGGRRDLSWTEGHVLLGNLAR